MDLSQDILSDIIVFQKYARYIPEINRRESWKEICYRNMEMHLRKFPNIDKEIKKVYKNLVIPKKILPSMRSLQFAGSAAELSNIRIYNCSYMPLNSTDSFSELMALLLFGAGVGYSVRKHHVNQLPVVVGPKNRQRRFLIGDSVEGWADSIKVLLEAYLLNKSDPNFDYRGIREKGAKLITSGGRAPGPDPLRVCTEKIRSVLNNAIGRKLKTIEAHDICCHIADAVLSGGIRRAAMISLFDKDDLDMMAAKSGDWYILHPHRGRANNSVILNRQLTEKHEFERIWEKIQQSGCGEPGIAWIDNDEGGMNPCAEVGLYPHQFCNLVEINGASVDTQEEFNLRAKGAAFLATLQAAYTDFHYLRGDWKEQTEKEALIGVGITGIASPKILSLNESEAAQVVLQENERMAHVLGINKAARCTVVKPAGTTSCVLGTSSGIHPWHSQYYIRRVRVGKNEALYKYLSKRIPELIEDCQFKPHIESVVNIPQKAPDGVVDRSEGPIKLLERVKRFNSNWIKEGHRSGENINNVSCTVSIKKSEWDRVSKWIWNNREHGGGISVLPHDGGTYIQAPFEEIDKKRYDELCKYLKKLDLTKVVEEEDGTDLKENLACSGGSCEI